MKDLFSSSSVQSHGIPRGSRSPTGLEAAVRHKVLDHASGEVDVRPQPFRLTKTTTREIVQTVSCICSSEVACTLFLNFSVSYVWVGSHKFWTSPTDSLLPGGFRPRSTRPLPFPFDEVPVGGETPFLFVEGMRCLSCLPWVVLPVLPRAVDSNPRRGRKSGTRRQVVFEERLQGWGDYGSCRPGSTRRVCRGCDPWNFRDPVTETIRSNTNTDTVRHSSIYLWLGLWEHRSPAPTFFGTKPLHGRTWKEVVNQRWSYCINWEWGSRPGTETKFGSLGDTKERQNTTRFVGSAMSPSIGYDSWRAFFSPL